MRGLFVQICAATIMSLGNILTGTCFAWLSHSLYTLQSEESPTGSPISEVEANLVGSMLMLGNFVMTPFSGWVSDMIGKRKTCILVALGLAISWAIITTARSIYLILLGRLILGLVTGVQAVICFPFVVEISQDSYRGTLSSILIITYTFGLLFEYLIGWFCSYNVVNYINLTLSVSFVVLAYCLKETPAFLIRNGQQKEALKSLQFYRGSSKATVRILEEMAQLSQQDELHDKASADEKLLAGTEKGLLDYTKATTPGSEISPWKMLCSSKPAQRALFIVSFHILLVVLCGTIVMTTSASQLFEKAAPNLSKELCAVILSTTFFVSSVLSLVICDMVGRRVLMLCSTILSAIFLALLASLLRWSWAPEWMVPVVVLGYSCVFQMGAASVPLLQISECFAHKLKNLASTVANSIWCLANFILVGILPFAVQLLGLDGLYLAFCLVSISLTVSTYYLMRETRGRSVEEIQKMFEDGLLYRKK